MSGVLKDLQPGDVFKYFEEINDIPRGSGNEKAISDYLVAFAKAQGLEVIQDQVLNVIIKKPATPGYENAPTVILQGHMDMVCEKNKGTVHDFEKDPIRMRIVDDMIYATDTTLGADNGIAVAYALSILASKDIPHPAIEALITTDEECTMGGATNLDPKHLTGKMLINLDSEEEGFLLVSSAGGTKAKLILPVQHEAAKEGSLAFKINIGGLKGGHSGADIEKGRGNANKMMGRVLNDLTNEMEYQLKSIDGGLKSNAITREADAVIFISPILINKLEHKICEWDEILRNELSASDGGVYVKLEKLEGIESTVLSDETKNQLIATIVVLPNGIQSMSMHIKGLVESSTNLGVVETGASEVMMINEIRSSVKSLKRNILNQIEKLGKLTGCKLSVESDYPEWAYNPVSKLRDLFESVYKEKYGKAAEIIAIHAGLECGVLSDKIEGMDAISVGPNMYDVHTPNEHISISSTKNTYEYLLEVLKQANTL